MPVILFIIILVMTASRSMAQSGGLVADMSSRKPLRDAVIMTDGGERVTTDYRGQFFLSGKFRGATILCKGYIKRNMTAEEMQRDTIFLIPNINTLKGVEIIAPNDGMGALKRSMDSEAKAIPIKPKTGFSFDFFSLFDRSKRRVSKKERERQKRILDNY